jgi:hypothetical protein
MTEQMIVFSDIRRLMSFSSDSSISSLVNYRKKLRLAFVVILSVAFISALPRGLLPEIWRSQQRGLSQLFR